MPIEWSTVQQSAQHFQVSTKTIRRWITDGRIEAKRFGPKLIRVNLASLESSARPLQYSGDAA